MSDSDDKKYQEYQCDKLQEWELLCVRCGSCCGAFDGDPCENLRQSEEKTYYCAIYSSRFGEYVTKSGRKFKCVPIKNILNQSWPGDHKCSYKKT